MKFTLRDLFWITVFAALLVSNFVVGDRYRREVEALRIEMAKVRATNRALTMSYTATFHTHDGRLGKLEGVIEGPLE